MHEEPGQALTRALRCCSSRSSGCSQGRAGALGGRPSRLQRGCLYVRGTLCTACSSRGSCWRATAGYCWLCTAWAQSHHRDHVDTFGSQIYKRSMLEWTTC